MSFDALYNSTVTVRTKTGADSWGKPTFGAPSVHAAKWRRVESASVGTGIVENAAHLLHMRSIELRVDVDVTLPDGTVHPVRAIRYSYLPGGWEVMEVQL